MNNLKQSKGWIFDLDGTLSHAIHDFAAIRNALNIPPDSDILGYIASQRQPLQDELNQRLYQLELSYLAQTTPAQGVVQLLTYLHCQQKPMAILTRNSKEIALETLKVIGIEHYFQDGLVLGREQAKVKPDPDGIHQLCGHWGVPEGAVVMVGDYHYDLQAGRRAGAVTIHISTLGRRWPEYTDYHFNTLSELLGSLTRLE